MSKERDKLGKFMSKNNEIHTKSQRGKHLTAEAKVQQAVAIGENETENTNTKCTRSIQGHEDLSWDQGRRVVELGHLAQQMYCSMCNMPLHLSDTAWEQRYGLGSVLHIRCKNEECVAETCQVSTGKRGPSGAFDINKKVTLGFSLQVGTAVMTCFCRSYALYEITSISSRNGTCMEHAGIGHRNLTHLLSSCNIPALSFQTVKKIEKLVAKDLMYKAEESCQNAREEEKTQSSEKLQVSFDAGWQKRGTGWNYNSLSGHATMIGKETGKIVAFDLRTKACKVCEYHESRKETVPNHECLKNWKDSSKAMEQDMASSMVHHLQQSDFNIKTFHADNDSATTARLQIEMPGLEKKDDFNHIKKSFSKSLYGLSNKASWMVDRLLKELCPLMTYKIQLSGLFSLTDGDIETKFDTKEHKILKGAEVIPYIVRCFTYAIKQSDEPEEIASNLDRIIPHIFGDHSRCIETGWCKYKENPEKYRYSSLPDGKPLKGEQLKSDLLPIIEKYKTRSHNLSDLGSTQANESFNNSMASKAPKSRHYSGSVSLRNRLCAAVLQKNEGYTYMTKVNKAVNLSPGHYTEKIGKKYDRIAAVKRLNRKSTEFKRKRAMLKKKKIKSEHSHIAKEPTTYTEGFELLPSTGQESNISVPEILMLDGSESFVVFDLETTGLSRRSDIIQLAAATANDNFNSFVIPRLEISIEASKVTGITFSRSTNKMFHKGKEVETKSVNEALLDFISFLEKLPSPVLIGHNCQSFDVPILVNHLKEHGYYSHFATIVKGCVDSLKVARRVIPREEVNGSYKLESLVNILPAPIEFHAHDASEDVKVLLQIFSFFLRSKLTTTDLFSIAYHACRNSFDDLFQQKIVSKPLVDKLSRSGISLRHIRLAFQRSNQGVVEVLKEHGLKSNSFSKRLNFLMTEE